MSLIYDPKSVKDWSTAVVEYLNGGPGSIKGCVVKFNEQIEKLVQPDVWTGSAAAHNFKNFAEAHNALIKFTNTFGDSFANAMTNVAKSVNDLEVSNLGIDSTVAATFGSLSYSQLEEMGRANILQEVTRYNYTVISEIGSALASIKSSLENVVELLINKINDLDSGKEIWDGQAACDTKEELISIINTNMTEINHALDVCINNISAAAEAAQIADQA